MKHIGNLVVGPSIHAISSVCLMFCHHQWIHRSCIVTFACTQTHQLMVVYSTHCRGHLGRSAKRRPHGRHLICIQQTLWRWTAKSFDTLKLDNAGQNHRVQFLFTTVQKIIKHGNHMLTFSKRIVFYQPGNLGRVNIQLLWRLVSCNIQSL